MNEYKEINAELDMVHQQNNDDDTEHLIEINEEQEKRLDDLIIKYDKKAKIEDAKTKLQEAETKRYEAIQKQKAKQRQAIKALLEHTGGNIPELYNKVNEELLALMKADKKLEFKEINFSEETAAFRIPKFASSFNMDGATDFYGMSMADQFLLYDRVGLFKGIVIDHTKDIPVDQGYRNAVKYLKEEKNNEASKPVNIFYKKPRLSGFFENNFSLDETQRKSQETGIFNMGFGLSVDYNYWATSAAVRAGFSYGKEWLQEKNISVKKIAITSNFFLPKIELSFDTLQPCADDSLMFYLENVFNTNDTPLTKFENINTILMSFGHFVPTSLIVGGRIYSSDVKEISEIEEFDNVQTQYAANFQAAFSTMKTEVGVQGQTNHSSGGKDSNKRKNENSSLTLNAIGGEGALVNDTEKWVKSTEKYTSWGLVRFDNLVPIIDVLPDVIKEKCTNLFNQIVNDLTIEEILQRNAHYLFYKGYFERFGNKAKPKFFAIKSLKSTNHVLTINTGNNSNNKVITESTVKLSPFDRNEEKLQLWYISNSGKIYSQESYDKDNKLVLSFTGNNIMVTIEDYYENQYWQTGGGRIVNAKGNTLEINNDGTLKLSATGALNTAFWDIVSKDDLTKIKSVESKKSNLLSAKDSNILLSDQYITLGEEMVSVNGKISLKIDKNKLVIKSTNLKISKELYHFSIDASVTKLALMEGSLVFLNENDLVVSNLCDSREINQVILLDNGNFEALNSNNKIVWESNSIIYSTIKNDSENVLSIHHSDFAPDMNHSVISVTVMPFVKADHQLWYINSLGQIICKATHGNKKFGLACNNNGNITVVSTLDSTNQDTIWVISSKSQHYGTIENPKHTKKLKSENPGICLSGSSTDASTWLVESQTSLYGINNIAKIKKPKEQHGSSDHYFNFYSSNDNRFMHTGWITINKAEIKGIKIYRDDGGNRYKLKIKDINGNEYYDDSANTYSEMDRSKAKYQMTPIYLKDNVDKLGFSRIRNDQYMIETEKDSTKIINYDERFVSMEDNDDKIKFIDRNWALADDNEKVIGIGLGTQGNRLVPYLVTILKK